MISKSYKGFPNYVNPIGITVAHWLRPRNVLWIEPPPTCGIYETFSGYYRRPLTVSTKRSHGTTVASPKIGIHGKLCRYDYTLIT